MTATANADQRARAQQRLRWELLVGLIRKDLKVKYQGSVLGFVWSLANPLLMLVVYSFVFQVVLKAGIPQFGFFLLCGLLVWNAFASSVTAACDAVVGNAGLVKKVRFPLAVLPLTAVGYAVVHFALQLLILFLVMTIAGQTAFVGYAILLIVPALLVAFVFMTAISYLVAALNVRYRDTRHLVEVLLIAGFWVNPIVYTVALVEHHLGGFREWLYYSNPMAGVVVSMQRAIYARDPVLPDGKHVLPDPGYAFYLERLAVGGAVSALLLVLGLWTYHRLSADFAEEL